MGQTWIIRGPAHPVVFPLQLAYELTPPDGDGSGDLLKSGLGGPQVAGKRCYSVIPTNARWSHHTTAVTEPRRGCCTQSAVPLCKQANETFRLGVHCFISCLCVFLAAPSGPELGRPRQQEAAGEPQRLCELVNQLCVSSLLIGPARDIVMTERGGVEKTWQARKK